MHVYGSLVARAFAIQVTGSYLNDQFQEMMTDLRAGKHDKMDINHHLLAGYKSIFTDENLEIAETCRKACGGAGFASSSGFTAIFADASAQLLTEGDNTVLLLASAKYLVKLITMAQKGQSLKFPFAYLTKMNDTLATKNKGLTVEECLDINVLDLGL